MSPFIGLKSGYAFYPQESEMLIAKLHQLKGALPRTVLGTEIITGLSNVTAASLPNIPAIANVAEIQVDGGIIRVRRDAVAPTATVGWKVEDGMSMLVDTNLANVRLLTTSGTVNVQVVYFDRA